MNKTFLSALAAATLTWCSPSYEEVCLDETDYFAHQISIALVPAFNESNNSLNNSNYLSRKVDNPDEDWNLWEVTIFYSWSSPSSQDSLPIPNDLNDKIYDIYNDVVKSVYDVTKASSDDWKSHLFLWKYKDFKDKYYLKNAGKNIYVCAK